MAMTTTLNERAYNVLKAFPEGLAHFEFIELLDGDLVNINASAVLSWFVTAGLAEKRGQRVNPKTGAPQSVYVPTGQSFRVRQQEKRLSSRGRKGPFEAEVKELRKWKADAIARFPELAVDPIVLRARNRVASILREEGNIEKALMVEKGLLDDGELMRVVISVMKEAEA